MPAMLATRPNRVVTMPGKIFVSCSTLPRMSEELEKSDMASLYGGGYGTAARTLWNIVRDGAIYDAIKTGIVYAYDMIQNMPPYNGQGVSELYSPMGYDNVGLRRAYH